MDWHPGQPLRCGSGLVMPKQYHDRRTEQDKEA